MKCCENKDHQESEIDKQDLEGLICYCFKHSKKELYQAVQNENEQEIVNDIKEKMKNLGCFCETANPSGKCCLSQVNAFIKAFK